MNSNIINTDEKTQAIEILVKVLGTMVIEPNFESDPNQIGKKIHLGGIQKPIVEGKDRDIVLAKLINIIEKL